MIMMLGDEKIGKKKNDCFTKIVINFFLKIRKMCHQAFFREAKNKNRGKKENTRPFVIPMLKRCMHIRHTRRRDRSGGVKLVQATPGADPANPRFPCKLAITCFQLRFSTRIRSL